MPTHHERNEELFTTRATSLMRRRQTKPFEMASIKFKWDVSSFHALATTQALAHASAIDINIHTYIALLAYGT